MFTLILDKEAYVFETNENVKQRLFAPHRQQDTHIHSIPIHHYILKKCVKRIANQVECIIQSPRGPRHQRKEIKGINCLHVIPVVHIITIIATIIM